MKARNLALTSVLLSTIALSAQTVQAADDPAATDVESLLDMPIEKLMDIVTGTRDIGVRAWQSTTPIEIFTAEQLAATGQNNVFDALMALSPSMSWQAGNDLNNIVRSARLRGMSPGEVLVLINGKRRHPTARLDYEPNTPTDEGSNPVDIELIPLSMIDHVEILLDGASAQYGSDAVAGVINFILKRPSDHGTAVTTGAGLTSAGDGGQQSAGVAQGIALGADGALNLNLDVRHQGYAHRTGTLYGTDVPDHFVDYPEFNLVTTGFNLDKPIDQDIDFYAFATAASRRGQTYEFTRVTSAFDPTVAALPAKDLLPSAVPIYPTQFSPRATLSEVDVAITVGIKKRNLAGWDWDLSTTYGRDNQNEGVVDTLNTGLLAATGASPTSAYIGNQSTSQLTTNLDLRRPFPTSWLAAPLNVAFGLEQRVETWSEGAGVADSYLYGGMQAYAGKTPSDASDSSRNVEAAYLDLSTRVVPQWIVDLAGRFEDYSQTGVGSSANGKLTTRYDFSPDWAVRATVGNGFHAPTLAQSHFSDTTVFPPNTAQSFAAQLPVASAGGILLGAPPLKPEKSKNIDIGVVATPLSKLHVTLDAYRIDLTDRIIDTGYIGGSSASAATNALVSAALAANGDVVAPGTVTTLQFFTNGVDTRTRGIDFSADYSETIGQFDKIKWTLDGNYNHTTITNVRTPTPTLAAAGITYVNPVVVNDLTAETPAHRITLAALYSKGSWDFTARETRYGYCADISPNAHVPDTIVPVQPAYLTDVDIGYHLTDRIKLSIGGNNVFDKLPPAPPVAAQSARLPGIYPFNTPWGTLGALYYVRLSASF
jgi:iron complex outermembrane receptor protein